MRSATSPHRETSKVRPAGRHRARPGSRRTARIIGVAAVPVVALVGGFAAYHPQPSQANPIASSLASYQLQSSSSGGAVPEVAGEARISQLAATGSASATGTQHATARPATTRHQATHHSSSSGTRKAAATVTVACSGTGGTGGTGMLPYNYATIVNFLAAHGYTAMAAAGVAGNIYQESGGNPESVGTGGGGLIGWTPLPAGFVTGDVSADLQTQLAALLTYNEGWAQYIPLLNSATTPTAAADVYMNYFERPGLPAAYNREGAAVAVAQACGITS